MEKFFQKYCDVGIVVALVPLSISGIASAMSPTKTGMFEGVRGVDINPLSDRLFLGPLSILVLCFAITCLRDMYVKSRG